jgi:cytoskeletal protein CcmA (bactofilin family)
MCRLSTNALTTTGEKQILLSPSSTASLEPSTMSPSDTLPVLPTGAGPATIAKSLQVKGELICSGWLYIDGKVEGAISLPGGRVTVGRYALVAANISAREVVILGDVCGNIDASDRVDIRGESS